MKKWFLILFLFLVSGITVFAQQDDADADGSKLQSRMKEYIQQKLGLTKAEAEKFTPVFNNYFREFAEAWRENRADKLVLKQKIIDLRLRYRTAFQQFLDADRANKIFRYEDTFRKEARQIILENRRTRTIQRRTNALMLQ